MNRWVIGGAVALAAVSSAAWAQGSFCDGFKAGWTAAFQNHGRMAALTPLCPLPPLGGNSFQSGYEAGLEAALRYMSQNR